MNPRTPDRGDGAILMALLRKLNPVQNPERYTDEYWTSLHREFRFHQRIAEIACVIGMFPGLFAPWVFTHTFQVWDIGIGFGLMVVFPLSYIFCVGLYKGVHTTLERYADYSTMMYGIPWKAQFYWLGLPILVLGVFCLFGRVLYPIDLTQPPEKTEQGAAANP